nr:GNAT family N-acetyltransferase [uncultured Flavobacterium sp.]
MNTQRTTSNNLDFQQLVVLLDEFLAIRDGEDHDFYAQFDTLDNINHVVVIYQDNNAIGCGAFKKFDSATVEIKRMFVNLDYQGKRNCQQYSERIGNLGKRIELHQLCFGNRHKQSGRHCLVS